MSPVWSQPSRRVFAVSAGSFRYPPKTFGPQATTSPPPAVQDRPQGGEVEFSRGGEVEDLRHHRRREEHPRNGPALDGAQRLLRVEFRLQDDRRPPVHEPK